MNAQFFLTLQISIMSDYLNRALQMKPFSYKQALVGDARLIIRWPQDFYHQSQDCDTSICFTVELVQQFVSFLLFLVVE